MRLPAASKGKKVTAHNFFRPNRTDLGFQPKLLHKLGGDYSKKISCVQVYKSMIFNFFTLSVRLFGTKCSKALNLHLYLIGQSQVSLGSVSGQSQVSLRPVSGQSQVSLRSDSGQSQASLSPVSVQSKASPRPGSGESPASLTAA